MIDLYFWPTPNGKKITILLEEAGIPYNIKPVNIGRGDQLTPDPLTSLRRPRRPSGLLGASSVGFTVRASIQASISARRNRQSEPTRKSGISR
jgi:hypothetical protein